MSFPKLLFQIFLIWKGREHEERGDEVDDRCLGLEVAVAVHLTIPNAELTIQPGAV